MPVTNWKTLYQTHCCYRRRGYKFDCVGTSNRQNKSVTQFELMPQPPKEENKGLLGHIGRKNYEPHLVIKRDAKDSSLWLLRVYG